MNLLEENNETLTPEIVKAIKEMGFEQMTPIQEQAIPVMLGGKDLIGQAQTGTGKTAAFGIPVIQSVDVDSDMVQAIVLCPTRELAIQASEEMRKFAKYMHGVKILPIYGGQDINRQIRSLKAGVSIVVGTPGRIMDHMRRHTLKLDQLKVMVLDEADEMLNMGFRENIETILAGIPAEHQTALFSATMPQAILDITKQYLHDDAELVKVTHKELTIPLVKQYYYEVNSANKAEVAARLLDYYNPKRCLIFCNTKHMVDTLCEILKGRGYFAEGLHGDMSQNQRDKVMKSFRNDTVEILIATDVAARGIDVDDVEAVINYDIPQDIEYYVHRIGRTGRAGRKGRAFTLVVGKEIYKIREIERVCKTTMKPRQIPSAKDVTSAKAESVFEEVIKIQKEEDLTTMMHLIEEKIEDYDCTAIEFAAAFLKMQMGEAPKEIRVEKYDPKKNRRNNDRNGNRNGRFDRKSGGNNRNYKKSDRFDGRKDGRKDDRKDSRKDDRKDGRKEKPKDYKKDYKKDNRSYQSEGNDSEFGKRKVRRDDKKEIQKELNKYISSNGKKKTGKKK